MAEESGAERSLLLLIDGHSLVYRGFYALQNERPLTNARGELTTGVYAFTSMLLKALDQVKPRYLAAAFDMSKPVARLEQLESYKANRAPTPEGLRLQVTLSRRVLEAMQVPMYDWPGFEADDVLGTLAVKAAGAGLDTIVLTGDNDLLQLVGPRVRVLSPRRGISDTVLFDTAAVEERYGLRPDQIPDFKALRGDTSDNIPGVPGIGDKTAAKLLQEAGTVESLLDHLDGLKDKLRDALAAHRDQVLLAKRLATIVCDLPVELELDRAQVGDLRTPAVRDVFNDLSFKSLVDRLPSAPSRDGALAQPALFGADTSAEAPEGRVAGSVEELEAFLRRARTHGTLAFNVQATGVQATRADMVGIGLAADGEAIYVPLGHSAPGPLDRDAAARALATVLADPSVAKHAHNAKFHMVLLARNGLPVTGLAFDTMIAAYLLESGQRAMALRDVAWSRLQVALPSVASLLGTGKRALSMADLSPEACAGYACQEATLVEQLVPLLAHDLEAAQQSTLFRDVELPLVPVLAEMELAGIQVDLPYLKQFGAELQERLAEIEAAVYELAGHPFNINSTQQLSRVLFEELGLSTGSRRGKTKTGHQSTGVEVLEELRAKHPIVSLLLEHRQLQKLKSTYVDALQLLVDKQTGRVHTTFNQTVAATGRLSSSDPNLQNIPVRTELGRRVRRAFVAREGAALLSADYSQIELRILADMADDPTLLEAFAEGEDPHAATAAEVLGIPYERVTSDDRRVAKMVNYGVLYGMSEFGLAERTGLPPAAASRFIRGYFERFGTVRKFQDRILREAEERGYTETLLGRRRYFPELRNKIHAIRQEAIRQTLNAPLQGTASDIAKIAMIHLDAFLKEEAPSVTMLLQVHDELLLEGPEAELLRIAPRVVAIMESARELKARLHVDLKLGSNWEDLRPITLDQPSPARA